MTISLQPKVVQTVQQHVSYESIWTHRICDYIYLTLSRFCYLYLVECSLLRAV